MQFKCCLKGIDSVQKGWDTGYAPATILGNALHFLKNDSTTVCGKEIPPDSDIRDSDCFSSDAGFKFCKVCKKNAGIMRGSIA